MAPSEENSKEFPLQKWYVAGTWDEAAPFYHKEYERHLGDTASADKLLRFAKIQDGEVVVEMACGTGALGLRILETIPGVNYFGCDSSIEFLKLARPHILSKPWATGAKGRSVKIDFTKDNQLTKLETHTGKADVIICQWTIHMFEDFAQTKIIRLWLELLKPGGRIVFTTRPTPSVTAGYVNSRTGAIHAVAGEKDLQWNQAYATRIVKEIQDSNEGMTLEIDDLPDRTGWVDSLAEMDKEIDRYWGLFYPMPLPEDAAKRFEAREATLTELLREDGHNPKGRQYLNAIVVLTNKSPEVVASLTAE